MINQAPQNLNRDQSLQLAWETLRKFLPESPTAEQIRQVCGHVHSLVTMQSRNPPSVEEMARHAESMITVQQDPAISLTSLKDHKPWLAATTDRPKRFWPRYQEYMEDRMPISAMTRLEESTATILDSCHDPLSEGPWQTRGLVVGDVQSGKTGNFIGLICRAVDAGYPFVVVLAGMQNDLRGQTQLRIDEGFLGFDTKFSQRSNDSKSGRRIGVGARGPELDAASLTTSADNQDFRKEIAEQLNLPIGVFPVIAVIKKHTKIMQNLRKWLEAAHGQDVIGPDGESRKVITKFPLFLLDDEADQASINTNPDTKVNKQTGIAEDVDPAAVNREIRKLLAAFGRRAYIGYTATPYANLFTDETADGYDSHAWDVFPEDFIVSLRPNDTYFGPRQVFGWTNPDDEGDNVVALPIFRRVKDSQIWVPPRHKTDYTPPDSLPASLTEAMYAFLLATAARRARGDNHAHNSMLVHVTRLQEVQDKVRQQIADWVTALRQQVRVQDNRPSAKVWEPMATLWNRDFVPTTARCREIAPGLIADTPEIPWEQIRLHVSDVLDAVRVRSINGTSKDALDYFDNRDTGLTVIAVGGDKLSRGLTLEGLSVSYYLRATSMYDTLLQMGRWFGYRPRYGDLCRLYTTRELYAGYREITIANEELRREFEAMQAAGATPRQFGLGVKASPNGFLVTSPTKMRRAKKVRLTFSEQGPETTTFDIRQETLQRNRDVVEILVDRCDKEAVRENPRRDRDSRALRWSDVPAEAVADFLDSYQPDTTALRVRPTLIAAYIRQCAAKGELGHFSVMIASVQPTKDKDFEDGSIAVAGHTVQPVMRAATGEPQIGVRFAVRAVTSPQDEMTDLPPGMRNLARARKDSDAAAIAAAKAAGNKPDPQLAGGLGTHIRRLRDKDQALLIIYPLRRQKCLDLPAGQTPFGFKLSLPKSKVITELSSEMVVNSIWGSETGAEQE